MADIKHSMASKSSELSSSNSAERMKPGSLSNQVTIQTIIRLERMFEPYKSLLDTNLIRDLVKRVHPICRGYTEMTESQRTAITCKRCYADYLYGDKDNNELSCCCDWSMPIISCSLYKKVHDVHIEVEYCPDCDLYYCEVCHYDKNKHVCYA